MEPVQVVHAHVLYQQGGSHAKGVHDIGVAVAFGDAAEGVESDKLRSRQQPA